MTKRFLWAAITGGMVLAAGLLMGGCPQPTDDDDDDPVTVTGVVVSPAAVTVELGGTQAFTAVVEGTGNPAQTVTWSVDRNGHDGTVISETGVLTVAVGETAAGLIVTAVSTADPAQSGAAAVTVSEITVTVNTVTVSPASVTVAKGGIQSFTAEVAGTGNPAQTVTWTVTGGITGTTISETGLLTVAPGETAASLTVTAASAVDPAKSGTAAVTIAGAATVTAVTVSPATATVDRGSTQAFTAVVEGTGNPAQTVTWSVTGNASTQTVISETGVLTVPYVETAASLTVTAASMVDPAKSGTAAVDVTGANVTVTGVTISPATVYLVTGATQAFSAVVAGTGDPAQTVTWSVTGNNDPGTAINAAGVLAVAAGETAETLTVTAVSTVDTSQSKTAAVTMAGYTEMVLATPNAADNVTITGSSAYYYDLATTNEDEKGVFIEGRTVVLSPFQIGRYEVTYELWDVVYQWATDAAARKGNVYAISSVTGSTASPQKYRPATSIIWNAAIIWCNAYSEMRGLTPVYYTDSTWQTVIRSNTGIAYAVMRPGANGYRLPTEAEWEYAARGGKDPSAASFTDIWPGTDTESELGTYAWYNLASSLLQPVGTKTANGLGLYDMAGNVVEYCWDVYESPITVGSNPEVNPTGAAFGTTRTRRGGTYRAVAANCTVARRASAAMNAVAAYTGFRVVRAP